MTDLQQYFSRVDEAAAWMASQMALKPTIAVVLSGGLGGFADALKEAQTIASGDIPHYPRSRAEGHAGKLVLGKQGETQVLALSGRVHCYEGHSPQQVVFPIFVLAKLGITTLITTNAVGGINWAFAPGDIMLVEDHINMMGLNPLIGLAIQRPTNQFTSMTKAYDEELRHVAIRVAGEQKLALRRGVYLATSGPNYETKAEIRAFRQLGADAVGMSTVPEIIAANFANLRCLSFSCVANQAADLHEGTMSHAEVLAAMNAMSPKMVSLLQGVVAEIGRL